MSIRYKFLVGFGLLVIMLAAAGFMSINELRKVSYSVQNLLDDNYQTIDAAQMMLEALEREDSGVLLLLMGKWEEGRETIQYGDSLFSHYINIARNNVTIEGEADIVERIEQHYTTYKSEWKKPIAGTSKEGNFEWYYNTSHQHFLQVKHEIKNLMVKNQKVMYDTSHDLKNKSHRAVMPGVIAIISGLLYVLLFNYFIRLFFVRPILDITNGLQRYVDHGISDQIIVSSNDELKQLAETANKVMTR